MNNLNQAKLVMMKEFKSYFYTPIAYIVITVFLIFTGFFFFKDFFYFNQAQMRSLFQTLPLMFSFVIPAVTMRLFSEERHSGTLEILLTLPVSSMDAVLGKFFAALAFCAVMLSPTLIYLGTVVFVGSPDPGPIIGGYFGSLFLAGAYSSIGILASSATKNQITAFIISWALCFALWLIDKITIFLPPSLGFISYLGTDFHFQNISRGVIDLRDIIYFISVAAISLMFSLRIIEERR
ncbi:MAG TPA: ABC transporter permease subunit [Spirochaetota bacterium]|nr:ABC transporter permease subunit [Spirochaetota bacterium]HPP94930.1 ABC transporter permease subunit [Spirochaetota bacterium]